MKKVIAFSKFYPITIIVYALILVGGFVLLFTMGLQKSIDFQAGLVAQVRFANRVASLQYDGPDTVHFSQDARGLYIVTTSISAESNTQEFLFTEYKTVADFIAAVNQIQGVTGTVEGSTGIALTSVFTGSTEGTRLSSEKALHLYSLDSVVGTLSNDEVRQTLASVEGLAVQQVGNASERTFQLRLADNNAGGNTSDQLKNTLTSALDDTYGREHYVFLTTDFMGSQFSSSLVWQSVILVLCSVVLIFLYVTIRFKWNFALAAIVALCFDTFIMIIYMVLIRMEISTFTVAALLTIIGYSVNNTVVLFDRLRENTRLFAQMTGTEVINKSTSEVLSRSIITTITTVVAILILFLFTSGGIQNFANVLLIGLISGLVTSLLLAPAILNLSCHNKKGQEIIKSKAIQQQ